MDTLPCEPLSIIGRSLAAYNQSFPNNAWHDGRTTASAAAACMIAGKTTWEIGKAPYSVLVARNQLVDRSELPSQNSTVPQLKVVLRHWKLKTTGRKAELWQRLCQEHTPFCPVPRNARSRDHILMNMAPRHLYTLGRHSTEPDPRRASLALFACVQGWKDAHFAEECAKHQREAAVRDYLGDDLITAEPIDRYIEHGWGNTEDLEENKAGSQWPTARTRLWGPGSFGPGTKPLPSI